MGVVEPLQAEMMKKMGGGAGGGGADMAKMEVCQSPADSSQPAAPLAISSCGAEFLRGLFFGRPSTLIRCGPEQSRACVL